MSGMLIINKKSRGFTIVEMMTVVVIMTLLITAAIPGYQNFVRNNEAIALATRLASSFRLAKGEAIKRGKSVSICPIAPGSTPADPTLSSDICSDTLDWDAWKVYEDTDGNSDDNGSEPIIRYVEDIPPGTIKTNIAGSLLFDPMGFAQVTPTNVSSWSWWGNYSYSRDTDISRVFHIIPQGCTGRNARTVEVMNNGTITVSISDCYYRQ